VCKTGEVEAPRRPRVDASHHRKGSGEDWLAFLEKAAVGEVVLFLSENLPDDFFQQADYATRVCHASDYPHEVDLVAAKEMIHDTIERPNLTLDEKAEVLGLNAKKFFRV
jgi:hypothetical protein